MPACCSVLEQDTKELFYSRLWRGQEKGSRIQSESNVSQNFGKRFWFLLATHHEWRHIFLHLSWSASPYLITLSITSLRLSWYCLFTYPIQTKKFRIPPPNPIFSFSFIGKSRTYTFIFSPMFSMWLRQGNIATFHLSLPNWGFWQPGGFGRGYVIPYRVFMVLYFQWIRRFVYWATLLTLTLRIIMP